MVKERWRWFRRIGLLLVGLCLIVGCGAKDLPQESPAAENNVVADETAAADDATAAADAAVHPSPSEPSAPSDGNRAEDASDDAAGNTVESGDPASGGPDDQPQSGDRRPSAKDGTTQAAPSPQTGEGTGKANGTDAMGSGTKDAQDPAARSAGESADSGRKDTDPAADKSAGTAPPTPADTVTLSILADGDLGVILEETEIRWEKGDTVLDVLKRATKQFDIQMEYRGSGAFAYVEGIDNLYEFDHGPHSGWVFTVNGNEVMRSAGKFVLQAGDRVEWRYVLERSDGDGQ